MSGKNLAIVLNTRVLFPEAQVEMDNDGQVIIYTGVYGEDFENGGYWVDARGSDHPRQEKETT